MAQWPAHPRIYEINTWVWLTDLSKTYDQPITLNNVPEAVIQELASYHVDAIWLMGVWYRSPAPRASALNYIYEYRGALPDVRQEDVIGSAYAIGGYHVDERIGGRQGLARFRSQLQQHGIKLILDFVPNHVATDHPWVSERPDYFILGTPELKNDFNFFSATKSAGESIVVAHGRDPYFPGWIDTAQLNAFSPGYRQAAIRTLRDIAAQCDGVRCDMAMLMMNMVFQNTWGWRGVEPPAEDFWPYVIPRIQNDYPDFIFIAETYWGLDHALQMQGFAYTYDKTMYDRLVMGDVNGVYAHLSADISFLKRNIRFIENHDEPRAADSLSIDRSRPAATLIHTVPGAVLLHEGQFDGRIIKLPVQIKRQPKERLHPGLKSFYKRLLKETNDDIYRHGEWRLLNRYPACDGCDGHHNIIAYCWRMGDDLRLVVINMSEHWSQALIDLGEWANILQAHDWQVRDALHDAYIDQDDIDLEAGFPVDLDAYHAHIYRFTLQPATSKPVQRAVKSGTTNNKASTNGAVKKTSKREV